MVSQLELDPGFAASLRRIERKVLAEVPLGGRSVRTIWVATVVLGCAGLAAWVTSDADGIRTLLGEIAVGFAVAGTVMSVLAVTRRRFGWCWIAAAISGLAVPLTILGYWSTQTGLGVSSVWLLVAAIAHSVLVGNWAQCARPPHPRQGP